MYKKAKTQEKKKKKKYKQTKSTKLLNQKGEKQSKVFWFQVFNSFQFNNRPF